MTAIGIWPSRYHLSLGLSSIFNIFILGRGFVGVLPSPLYHLPSLVLSFFALRYFITAVFLTATKQCCWFCGCKFAYLWHFSSVFGKEAIFISLIFYAIGKLLMLSEVGGRVYSFLFLVFFV